MDFNKLIDVIEFISKLSTVSGFILGIIKSIRKWVLRSRNEFGSYDGSKWSCWQKTQFLVFGAAIIGSTWVCANNVAYLRHVELFGLEMRTVEAYQGVATGYTLISIVVFLASLIMYVLVLSEPRRGGIATRRM